MEVATPIGLRPADFPIGSPQSRAAARDLAEQREIGAMQDWITVTMEDLKSAKVFARKLRISDTANPLKVRLVVRTHKTRQQAKDARNRVQTPWNRLSLTIDDEEEALRLVPLFAERHGGVVVYADVSVDDKG